MAGHRLAKDTMSTLRIFASPFREISSCRWAVTAKGQSAVVRDGLLSDLPRGLSSVQLILPATDVVFLRTRLPKDIRRRNGSVLAFAVEDQTLTDPAANQVFWLGKADDEDVLAIADRKCLDLWRNALEKVGIRGYQVLCETLTLPLGTNSWSLAWNGEEGFVRTSTLEGAATDRGSATSPPQTLRLLLDDAKRSGRMPKAVTIHPTGSALSPDVDVWQRNLGVEIRLAEPSAWETPQKGSDVLLGQEQRRWFNLSANFSLLKPAALILAVAAATHALASIASWVMLEGQKQKLNAAMESRFRAVFPDAVAVVDPSLQMRRKLAELRHGAVLPDDGDFLPMTARIAAGVAELPPGSLRRLSYETGRVTLEFAPQGDVVARRLVSRLQQSGLTADIGAPRSGSGTGSGAAVKGGGTTVVTVSAP